MNRRMTLKLRILPDVFISFLIFALIAGPLSLAAGPAVADNQTGNVRSLGTITFMLGDVSVQRHHITEWQPVSLNDAVYSGDRFRTRKESRLEIYFSNGGIIRIDENTNYQISSEEKASSADGSSTIFLDLNIGRIWSNIRTILGGKQEYQVRSPTAVMAVRGTIVRFDAEEDASEIYVYRGKVDVTTPKPTDSQALSPRNVHQPAEVAGPTVVDGPKEVSLSEWVQLVAGQMIQVKRNGEMERKSFDSQSTDSEWVSWNRERDGAPLPDK